ncbi:MAG: sugar phosphate isomerase/epimerase [Planctomycetota bacterium]|nr:sugar phosphate isomerase/epimerase [Planctomycetota bacterium]
MKIAASSCSWWHHTLEEGVALAQQAGFTAYEPLMFPDEVFPLHGNLLRTTPAELGALMSRHGMALAALHVAAIPTTPPARRQACVDYVLRAIDVAGETGCGLVVFGGPDRAREPFIPFLHALERIVPRLEGTSVRVALENHAGNWIQFIQDYEHIFDFIDSPALGITLDTGHFTASGVDPEAVARRFGPKIFHVHVKDHIGGRSVPLGTGETNNLGAVRALKAGGYAGYLSQEIECGRGPEADRAAADGIHYMRRLLDA